ncbi:MAG: glycoside hydrolase family 2 protein, partial [Bacteroidota bacterium]
LTTDHMAKGVFISAPGMDGNYSDNYFDLLPGESKTVRFSPSDKSLITGNPFEVKSLFETY